LRLKPFHLEWWPHFDLQGRHMTTNPPKLSQAEQTQTDKTAIPFKKIIVPLAIFAACLLVPYFWNFHGAWGNQGDFGAFGDFFGGILNPILGFATVTLLIWSLNLQLNELSLSRKELSLSRKELALTRQELAETKEETALSRRAMEAQVEHLQKEAKLNEITRLINDLKIKINVQLSAKFVPHAFRLDSHIQNIHEDFSTFASIINDPIEHSYFRIWYIRKAQREIQVDNFGQTMPNPNAKGWCELERLVTCFCRLLIKYDEISPSDEFNSVYIYEAYNYLAPLCETLRSEQLIKTMKDLNFEFIAIPKPRLDF